MFRLVNVVVITMSIVFAAHADKSPNIVFIIADDCTFRDIGCYGGQAHTPNIDRLADQGMRFTRCFQAAPMCSPTRHNIYTGQYPVKTGAYPNHTRVEPETKGIVHYLRPLGYDVVHTGKSHVKPSSVFDWRHLGKQKTIDFDSVDDVLGSHTQSGEPLCLLVCSNEPHTPWTKGDRTRYPDDKIQLPPYLIDTPETRDAMARYLAEITYFDQQVGDTLAALEHHGMSDNTMVMVVSEQGNSLPFAKWTCYDSGLQSACIVRWPGKVSAGTINHALIEYTDFLPTFIEIAGGEIPAILDGKSLMPILAGRQTHKQYVYGEMTTRGINKGSPHYGIRSVRDERYKYIWNFTPEAEFKNACTDSEIFRSWVRLAASGDSNARRLVNKYRYRPAVELYDIVADPFEMINLAESADYHDVKKRLRRQLDRWMVHCGDQGQVTEMAALRRQSRKRNQAQSP